MISNKLGVCLKCIRENEDAALGVTFQVHAKSRSKFGLPITPPTDHEGINCGLCMNNCCIPMDAKGFCGLVHNINGKLSRLGGTQERGILQWYYDPLPTNCVAEWFCPGCTGAGYPEHAYTTKAELGYSNLAVFYGACSFDCLYCQNWHYRKLSSELKPVMSAVELARKANDQVSCICYFGGDPSPQMPHAIRVSELAIEKARDAKRIMRICWESNGYMRRDFTEQAAELSLQSGGCIKFELKAWDENLNKALCGVSNLPTLENFKMIGERFYEKRSDLPVLTASTLLVPGYVDAEEVSKIAEYISSIDTRIPYSLLAFYPAYVMNDLPTTSRKLADQCYNAAKKRGLENVRVGNVQLLS